MIGIIDYDAGNIQNLQNALSTLSIPNQLINTSEQLSVIKRLILPGVGAFGTMMEYLEQKEMDQPIKEWILDDNPFLGICLGYQALFETSQEAKGIKGLQILEGSVEGFSQGKVPHMGWNDIRKAKPSTLFDQKYYYFVHSYFPKPREDDIIATVTSYHEEFASAIEVKNIVATQYHPERSGKDGLAFLKRWSQY